MHREKGAPNWKEKQKRKKKKALWGGRTPAGMRASRGADVYARDSTPHHTNSIMCQIFHCDNNRQQR